MKAPHIPSITKPPTGPKIAAPHIPQPNFMAHHNVQKFTEADGTPVTHEGLPLAVRMEAERIGVARDLSRGVNQPQPGAPSVPAVAGRQDEYQKNINKLYNPATRAAHMQQITMQRQLEHRLAKRNG